MQTTTRTVRRVTLGDLVAAAYDRAERTNAPRNLVPRVAARCLEARLRRAKRADLIRALALAERR